MNSALIVTILLWKHGLVASVRIKELQVPWVAAEGGKALLGCQFDLEDDDLYSVKWYKDGREFYRYVPSNSDTTTYFSMPGVFVDLSHSSSSVVALEHLTMDSAGLYRCEVSGEAPYFVTVYKEKTIHIHLLPNNKPRVRGLQNEYQLDNVLEANCTSSRSRPKTQIIWLINGQPPPKQYIRGPWERISRERPDARETTLELRFVLTSNHFREGVLTVHCQATLPPLYQEEVVHHILRVDSAPEPIDVEESLDAIPQMHEVSMVSENKEDIPFVNSENEEVKSHCVKTKLSVLAIVPSVALLLIVL